MPIIVTDITGNNVQLIPFDPPSLRTTNGANNTTLNTLASDVRLIGNRNLTRITWNSFFPASDYEFLLPGSSTNPADYINFFERNKNNNMPIRVILTQNAELNTIFNATINSTFTIDSFLVDWPQTNGDINYTITLTEFETRNWTRANWGNAALSVLNNEQMRRAILRRIGII